MASPHLPANLFRRLKGLGHVIAACWGSLHVRLNRLAYVKIGLEAFQYALQNFSLSSICMSGMRTWQEKRLEVGANRPDVDSWTSDALVSQDRTRHGSRRMPFGSQSRRMFTARGEGHSWTEYEGGHGNNRSPDQATVHPVIRMATAPARMPIFRNGVAKLMKRSRLRSV